MAVPNESTAKGGVYTVEKSKEMRTEIFTRWTDVIKPFCLNQINNKYMDFLVIIGASDKGLPSGTSEEDCILYIKQKLYDETQAKSKAKAKKTVNISGDDCDDDGGEEAEDTPPCRQVRDKSAMTASFDGGAFFLTWMHLGPLGSGRGDEHGAAVFHLSGGTNPKPNKPSAPDCDDDASGNPKKDSPGSKPPSYATLMQQEAKVETFTAELTARKDRVDKELKLVVQLASAEERADAEEELKKYLDLRKTPLPIMPARSK